MENLNLKMVVNSLGDLELDYDFYFPEEVEKEIEEVLKFQNQMEKDEEYFGEEEVEFPKESLWNFTKEEEEKIRNRIKKSLEIKIS